MWSLGTLIFKIFCADFPFKGKNEKELKLLKLVNLLWRVISLNMPKKIICSLIIFDPNKRMTCEDVLNIDWLKDK